MNEPSNSTELTGFSAPIGGIGVDTHTHTHTHIHTYAPWRQRVVRVANSPDEGADGLCASGQSVADLLAALALNTVSAEAVPPEQFSLRKGDDGWALWPPVESLAFGRLPLRIDFVHDARFSAPLTLKEPLARAVGMKSGQRPPIIDLTAGLGRDTWALASIGCAVRAFERHPLIHFLLADALARAQQHPATATVANRIQLHLGVAQTQIEALNSLPVETVWLFDPMFPPRQKSAEVKKEMRIFSALVGADADAEWMLSWARNQPGARWVVKRPHHAAPWSAHCPDFTVESARIRFDVFLPRHGRA